MTPLPGKPSYIVTTTFTSAHKSQPPSMYYRCSFSGRTNRITQCCLLSSEQTEQWTALLTQVSEIQNHTCQPTRSHFCHSQLATYLAISVHQGDQHFWGMHYELQITNYLYIIDTIQSE